MLPVLGFIFWQAHTSLSLPATIETIIFSAAFMLAFTILFLEHFFAKPSDVLSSALAILLTLSPVKNELVGLGQWYWILWGYALTQAIMALLSLFLADQTKSQDCKQNRIAAWLKNICTHTGNGRVLFASLFFMTVLFYVDSQSTSFLFLAAFASFWLLIDPKKLVSSLAKKDSSIQNDLGKIFGVQSKNTFLAKLHEDRKATKRFDLVEFRYSADQKTYRGMIIDNYLLNESQWVRVLCANEIREALSNVETLQIKEDNTLYKINTNNPVFLDKFAGVIIEGSDISKIKFEYAFKAQVSEGSLLELSSNGSKVYYQVVQGRTAIEVLESKNEAGIIVGEAVQLGTWDDAKRTFIKYGWVPNINTAVYLASDIEDTPLQNGECLAGTIPNSKFPVILNKLDAVTHHTAILGVTGTGKSVFARNLIRSLAQDGQKIVLVDFTGEHKKKLHDLPSCTILQSNQEVAVANAIAKVDEEKAKFANQRNHQLIADKEKEIHNVYCNGIKAFLEGDCQLAYFYLPNVENTSLTLELTKSFFKSLFAIARHRNNFGKNVCVALEEAHTIVPEHNSSGTPEQSARGLINSIGQIALQGRKYNIGFIVIAQRTANVSKTILTQCNSIIAFQQFDKTSGDFLTNYIGPDLVSALPILAPRRAIAVGKAFRTTMPMIFDVPHIDEPEAPPEAENEGTNAPEGEQRDAVTDHDTERTGPRVWS